MRECEVDKNELSPDVFSYEDFSAAVTTNSPTHTDDISYDVVPSFDNAGFSPDYNFDNSNPNVDEPSFPTHIFDEANEILTITNLPSKSLTYDENSDQSTLFENSTSLADCNISTQTDLSASVPLPDLPLTEILNKLRMKYKQKKFTDQESLRSCFYFTNRPSIIQWRCYLDYLVSLNNLSVCFVIRKHKKVRCYCLKH